MNNILDTALAEYGITEVVGSNNNPRILQYSKEIGYSWVQGDELSWCSIFANWVAMKAGYQRSGKLDARSWLKVGTPTTTPKMGDVVVFWRVKKSDWRGHVGFFINYSQDKKYIYVLGGNQNNQVCIKPYPVYRLLGFRSITHA